MGEQVTITVDRADLDRVLRVAERWLNSHTREAIARIHAAIPERLMSETQSVGYCHVGDPDAINREGHWVCADDCPHPDHQEGDQHGK